MKQLYVTALLLLTITSVTSYNVLMMMAIGSRSHKHALDPIAASLAKKGHQVTLFSPMETKEATPGVNNIFLRKAAAIMENEHWNFFSVDHHSSVELFHRVFGPSVQTCNVTFNEEPEVLKLIRDPKYGNYDVFIMDGTMNDFLYALGHHLGIPTIVVSPTQKLFPLGWAMNIPSPHAYVPLGLEYIVGPMTFTQRLQTTLKQIGFTYLLNHYLFAECDKIIEKVLPNTPALYDLQSKVAFLLTNSHPAIHHSIPAMPNFVEVGCLHCKNAKPLPKDLEDYMQSSGDHGVIYFSLGSVQQGSDMPVEMRDKILGVFGKLPQKVLWKYDQEFPGLPHNIKIIKWAPQQDILGHNKTRLFITHGGGLSSMEAAYHGCPLLGFPLSAEQWGNLANAVNKDYAETLDWSAFTADQLHNTIKRMLGKTRYQENADKVAMLLKDRLQDPVDTATYWIKYVIRHKGAPHLKSAAEQLNFFQYFLLDVIGFILLVLTTVLTLIFLVLRKCCQLVCKPKNVKLKSN